MVWKGLCPFQKYFPLSWKEMGIKGERLPYKRFGFPEKSVISQG